jgi:uncharacterized protein YdaU (DUF1376 family)
MKAPEIGAYWLLIMECWDRDNSLPDDIEELAIVARMPLKQFEKAWNEKIRRCFRFDGRKGIYWHKRLEQEIESGKRFSKAQSARGKKGADALHSKRNNLAGTSKPPPSQSMLTPSHDSISSALNPKKKREEAGPMREIFIGTILGGITTTLGINKLARTASQEWEEAAAWAYENEFSTDQFLDCYKAMRDKHSYSILPKYVMERLPDFVKRNKKAEQLPTLEEKLADDAANRAVLRTPPKATEVEGIQ